MNILYIGQYTEGTTSKMRADQLRQILKASPLGDKEVSFHIIDTHIPFHQTHHLWRSLGFRYKRGPLIKRINTYILEQIHLMINSTTSGYTSSTLQHFSKSTNQQISTTAHQFDLIWVDKAIFLTPKTTHYLKSQTNIVVHFTPDMAFYGNQSVLFEKSIKYYNYLVTTKSAEKDIYLNKIKPDQLIQATQGFDLKVHRPLVDFNQKSNSVAFIGLCEPSREHIIEQLLNNHIAVKIAGKGWLPFVNKHKKSCLLSYHGDGLFSEEYTRFISSSYFSIGQLSKKFPELHTTRTFEIPACGTALITERNKETISFFNEDEVIFYNSIDDMIEKIRYYQYHLKELEQLIIKGTTKVHADGRDYESILKNILKQIGINV